MKLKVIKTAINYIKKVLSNILWPLGTVLIIVSTYLIGWKIPELDDNLSNLQDLLQGKIIRYYEMRDNISYYYTSNNDVTNNLNTLVLLENIKNYDVNAKNFIYENL